MMLNKIQFGLATVTSHGLKFRNKLFSNSLMIKNNWFENVALYGEWQVPILYRQSDLTEIMLFDLNEIEVATSIDEPKIVSEEYIQGYFEAIKNIKEQLSQQSKSIKNRN
ncbi:hypothetical protein [Paenibacillus eucommiae]|uniref:Uncharacterized protein n=1 Tax=Paenibacillus eucommiae TaxID=1355755 RepID=A0ABS4IUE0_9BACL|nr:hypothetical protein [Paenibacillus eucommiae]MBP1991187.1 hypothetical protein [Paenibacillus eucommiae]